MRYGQLVKYYRKKAEMTQSELAEKAKVSTPYINKVEKGNLNAASDVLEEINDILDIKNKWDDPHENDHSFFHKLLDSLDSSECQQVRNTIITLRAKSINNPVFHLKLDFLEIITAIQENNLPSVQANFLQFENKKEWFDRELNFYYLVAKGTLSFLEGNELEALFSWEQAEKVSIENDKEMADLRFRIARVCLNTLKLTTAMDYIQKALNYYENIADLKALTKCYFLIGSYYRCLKDFQKAQGNFMKSRRIATQTNNQELEAGSLFNLAKLEDEKGNHHQSIQYNLEGLTILGDSSYFEQVWVILDVAKQYQKINDIEEMQKFIKKGLRYTRESKNKAFITCQKEFNLLESYFSKRWEEYERLLKELIKHYSANLAWEKVTGHAETLAKFYEDRKKYKQATIYLNIALDARRNMGIN